MSITHLHPPRLPRPPLLSPLLNQATGPPPTTARILPSYDSSRGELCPDVSTEYSSTTAESSGGLSGNAARWSFLRPGGVPFLRLKSVVCDTFVCSLFSSPCSPDPYGCVFSLPSISQGHSILNFSHHIISYHISYIVLISAIVRISADSHSHVLLLAPVPREPVVAIQPT